MKLELEIFDYLCSTAVFKINGVDADSTDFGEQQDRDSDNAPDYGCGDMQFTRIDSTPEVLAKYNITGPEYELVAGQLDALSSGSCGYCA